MCSQSNNYPKAFIQNAMNPKRTSTKDKQSAPLTTISIPYIKGISERIRRCLSQVDIQVAFRSRTTMRSLLMRVKPEQFPMEYKGVIYKIPCHDCDQATLGRQGHCIDWDSSSVIDKEDRLFQRRVKEALHIRRVNTKV